MKDSAYEIVIVVVEMSNLESKIASSDIMKSWVPIFTYGFNTGLIESSLSCLCHMQTAYNYDTSH